VSAESLARREGPRDVVAGFLCAFAIFFAGLGVIWHPLRLIPVSAIVALVATAMGGRNARLAWFAVVFTAGCFFVGMAIAVLTRNPLW
jgi:hypothetical protein